MVGHCTVRFLSKPAMYALKIVPRTILKEEKQTQDTVLTYHRKPGLEHSLQPWEP